MGEGELLVLLIALRNGDFPFTAGADALEGVVVVVVASTFLTVDLRSRPRPASAGVCFCGLAGMVDVAAGAVAFESGVAVLAARACR